MKVLVLGGYGVFGGRLVRLLAGTPGLELIVAGRDEAAARAFCAALPHPARPLQLDRAQIAAALASEKPDLVVDASGPFQDYGADPYLVPRAALASGADYLDLADGAAFVAGIGALDAQARAAGRFALAGASSFPVLTAAVLAEMSKRMEVTDLVGGIAPSPYAGVGLNVLRAVLGYAGAPVRLRLNGQWTTRQGLVSSRRMVVAVPGHLPLRPLRFSLVEVPDLVLLPEIHPALETLWMGAAPQPPWLHALLSALAWLRPRLKLPALTPLAPLAQRVLNLFARGEHRGGMVLTARGLRDGRPAELSWHLLAEGDDGPFIPSMAAEALIRACLAGRRPAPGARPAIGALTLDDYARVFAGRTIHTGWRAPTESPLYRRLLGPAFDALPEPLRRLHSPGRHATWTGSAEVSRGRAPLAGLVAALFGFPRAGSAVPLTVSFTTDAAGRETWVRDFAGRVMRSTQEEGRGDRAHLLVERFGPIAVALAVTADATGLRLIPRGWRLFGLPLPRALLPGGTAAETAPNGRFRFEVEIRLPLAGRIVRYEGRLDPA